MCICVTAVTSVGPYSIAEHCQFTIGITHVLPAAFLLQEFDPLCLAMSSLQNKSIKTVNFIFISFHPDDYLFNFFNNGN